ncbi:spliceosome-associated protein CWC27 homolog [Bolinopsis microptera]|uniref:spliceosome-associated protein CWC27 homolog n=1 Tax=Bolinopsis microptera TaxID=2820187 RepID=UPI00307AA61B
MSNIYNLEPVTKGKVLLTTSHGDIEIELWAREAPKACRNFVQLCLECYYDDTIFHRLVKGFCIQGGDPTGTGTGGDSIYGEDFADEFHQRLKFNRRGLLATANKGEPNSNGSQFFFTLGEAPELQKKHTIFGKVTGNTIFNVLRMAEMETDNNERPLEPPSIRKTEILNNPFDDIVTRDIKHKTGEEKKKEKKKKSQMKATKNFKLLSFGEEAEEDEEEVQQVSNKLGKISSAHDKSNDPSLSKEVAVSETQLKEDRDKIKTQAEVIREKLKKEIEDARPVAPDQTEKEHKLDALKKESEKLLLDIKHIGKEEKEEMKIEAEKDSHLNESERETVNEFRKELKEFKIKQSEKKIYSKKEREKETMLKLEKFNQKIKDNEAEQAKPAELPEDIAGEEEEELLNNINLFGHSLIDVDRKAKVKDANIVDDDTFEIYDPRHPINKRKREKPGKKGQKGQKGEDDKWKRSKLLT